MFTGTNPAVRLDATDAVFVDAIHSDAGPLSDAGTIIAGVIEAFTEIPATGFIVWLYLVPFFLEFLYPLFTHIKYYYRRSSCVVKRSLLLLHVFLYSLRPLCNEVLLFVYLLLFFNGRY